MWHARPRIFGREGAVGAVVMALGLSSHVFPVLGDGHQPNRKDLYTR